MNTQTNGKVTALSGALVAATFWGIGQAGIQLDLTPGVEAAFVVIVSFVVSFIPKSVIDRMPVVGDKPSPGEQA